MPTSFIEDRSVLTRAASPADAVIRYGELADHVADVRYGDRNPKLRPPTLRPLVIMIHGGFWRPQFDRGHSGALCEAIANAGWTVASIEYRRIPGQPNSMVNDVCLAIAQLPKLVQQHSTDVIVMGHSAGGQLALCAAVKCSSSKLIGALALGPIADLQYAYDNGIGDKAVSAFLGGPPSTHRDLDPCQLPSATIGITIVHGVQDAIAPLAMSENYLSHHANARLVKVESCGHFALIDPQSAAWPIVVEELAELSSS